jgi:hypothetical protein
MRRFAENLQKETQQVNAVRIDGEKARSEAAAFQHYQQEVACREDAMKEEFLQQESMLAQTTASAEGSPCCLASGSFTGPSSYPGFHPTVLLSCNPKSVAVYWRGSTSMGLLCPNDSGMGM